MGASLEGHRDGIVALSQHCPHPGYPKMPGSAGCELLGKWTVTDMAGRQVTRALRSRDGSWRTKEAKCLCMLSASCCALLADEICLQIKRTLNWNNQRFLLRFLNGKTHGLSDRLRPDVKSGLLVSSWVLWGWGTMTRVSKLAP